MNNANIFLLSSHNNGNDVYFVRKVKVEREVGEKGNNTSIERQK